MPKIRYRVVDLRSIIIDPTEIIVECSGLPEKAAKEALGLDLVRSGNRADLVARVYWQYPGSATNMVRLYIKAAMT